MKPPAREGTRQPKTPRKAKAYRSFDLLVDDPLDTAGTIAAVRKGVPAHAIEQAVKRYDIGQKDLLGALRIPASTFHRKLKRNEALSPDETEKVVRLGEVARRAEQTFGSPAAAREWLTTENTALGVAPISLIDTEAGAHQIRRILGMIDYGGTA